MPKDHKTQTEELKNQLVRVLADYDNLRKRVESEKANWEQISAYKVVLRILPIFDMLVGAQRHLKDSGLEIIIGEFRATLADLGAVEIKIKPGDAFSPHLAEVVETVHGGKQHTISEVVQSGWQSKDGDYVVRPAKVKVFGPKLEKKEKEELEKEVMRGDYV